MGSPLRCTAEVAPGWPPGHPRCRSPALPRHAWQGNTLTVTATVDWAVRSTYNTTFGTNVIEGISEYIFRGLIVAEATLGCPADCGPNGRCAQADDGALGCACQCGWSGANCTVPSGFCSSFPAELTGQAVCPVAPPASPAPAPDTPCQPSKGAPRAAGWVALPPLCAWW